MHSLSSLAQRFQTKESDLVRNSHKTSLTGHEIINVEGKIDAT